MFFSVDIALLMAAYIVFVDVGDVLQGLGGAYVTGEISYLYSVLCISGSFYDE